MSTSASSHIPNPRKTKAPRPLPSLETTLRARIQVLELAIVRLNGNSRSRPGKRNKHLSEIAQLNCQLRQIQDIEVQRTLNRVSQLTIENRPDDKALAPQDLSSAAFSTPLPHVEILQTSQPSPAEILEKLKDEVSQTGSMVSSAKTTSENSHSTEIAANSLESSSAPRQSSKVSTYETRRLRPARRDASSSPAPWLSRDAIAAPSAKSGGVPEPSQIYLSRSILESQTSNEPQNILLVIDLNGTLLYRPDKRRPTNFVERPLTQLFLDYVLSKFNVMIWSSAMPGNVIGMCDLLFRKTARKKLIAEWGRDRFGLTQADYEKRVQVYKRLEMVWASEEIQRRHPHYSAGESWGQTNTILIDDSLEKARSEPYNLVEITEFSGRKEPADVLRNLAEYLEVLLTQTNVSSYIRQNPFRVPVDVTRPIESERGSAGFG